MRIGDPQFYARLTEILQSRDPMQIPDLVDPDQIGITIAIDAELLLQRAVGRTIISNLARQHFRSDTELTLVTIAQGATATQLNQGIGDGITAGEQVDVLGFDLHCRMATFNAGDRAQVLMYLDTTIRSVFPAFGRDAGSLRVVRFWLDVDNGKTVDQVQILLPTPMRLTKTSTTVNNILAHTQVTNRRAAVGTIDVAIGGAVYFRPTSAS